jgi:hypothetical protein
MSTEHPWTMAKEGTIGVLGGDHGIFVVTQWRPTSFGKYKVNWDSALDQHKGKMGFGIIVHASIGKV